MLQIKPLSIMVLDNIDKNNPDVLVTVNGVPGDEINDFRSMDDNKIVAVSKNGYLSAFTYSSNCYELICQKRLKLKDEESPSSLEVIPGT